MVEDAPTTEVREPLDIKAPLLDEKAPFISETSIIDPDVALVKKTYITHTFCSTLRHLRAQAGCLSRYRGFQAFIGYTMINRLAASTLTLAGFLPFGFAPVVAALLTANLATTWTHVAISASNNQHWIRRIPGIKSWKKVAGPTFFMALAQQMTCMVPMYLAGWWGMLDMEAGEVNRLSTEERQLLVWKGLSVLLVGITMAVLFVLPAKVTLTRVQASILGENEDTIVPFDKTFGGRVVPESLGGKGAVDARVAWRTFGQQSRMNLFKAYGKVMMMEIVLVLAFCVAICAELVMIMGNDIRKFIPNDGQFVFGA